MARSDELAFKGRSRCTNTILRNKKTIFCIVLAAILGFIIGYLVRREVNTSQIKPDKTKIIEDFQFEKFYKEAAELVRRENLQDSVRFFAAKPHLTTSTQNNLLADTVEEHFKKHGLSVARHTYNVLLSFPRKGKTNRVSLYGAGGGKLIYNTTNSEGYFDAYTPSGDVFGEPVFANFGMKKDFLKLKELGINCTGKVVVIRQGKMTVSGVKYAESIGVLGLVVYPDPQIYAPVPDNERFPRGKYPPSDSVQVFSKVLKEGDLLTPGYPSKEWVFRNKNVRNGSMFKIPMQPISEKDAFHILSGFGEVSPPKGWKGGLNISYMLTSKKKLRLEVFNELVQRNITNIVGTITGAVEPDRMALLGAHRDAWVNGAVDDVSGTAIMLESARVMGQLMKTGWRPRRTVKFISWDAEEQGLDGSVEYVEEFKQELRDRAVVYLNVDVGVGGNQSMKLFGSYLFKQLAFESAKKVNYLNRRDVSVYDMMVKFHPDKKNKSMAKYGKLTTGSDYEPFYMIAGIPCVDISFRNYDNYTTYHTKYDVIEYVEKFSDPGYWAHFSTTKVTLELMLRASNDPLLPLSPIPLAQTLNNSYQYVQEYMRNVTLTLDTEHLEDSIDKFKKSAVELKNLIESNEEASALKKRMLNDIGVHLSGNFVKEEGLPTDPYIKNYIESPPQAGGSSEYSFPTLLDALADYNKTRTHEQKTRVAREISMVAVIVERAAHFVSSAVQSIEQIA